MQAQAEAQGNAHFSHFGLDNNLLDELQALFASYAETGQGSRTATAQRPDERKLGSAGEHDRAQRLRLKPVESSCDRQSTERDAVEAGRHRY